MKYLCLIYNEEKKLDLMARDELEVLVGECRGYQRHAQEERPADRL